MASSNTYTTKSGVKFEVTYDVKDRFNPYQVTKEERYTMKNIPFFVIPPSETLAFDPAKVKSKINTRNPTYSPPKPTSCGGTARDRPSTPCHAAKSCPATTELTRNAVNVGADSTNKDNAGELVGKRKSTNSALSPRELKNKAMNERYHYTGELVGQRKPTRPLLSPRELRDRAIQERVRATSPSPDIKPRNISQQKKSSPPSLSPNEEVQEPDVSLGSSSSGPTERHCTKDYSDTEASDGSVVSPQASDDYRRKVNRVCVKSPDNSCDKFRVVATRYSTGSVRGSTPKERNETARVKASNLASAEGEVKRKDTGSSETDIKPSGLKRAHRLPTTDDRLVGPGSTSLRSTDTSRSGAHKREPVNRVRAPPHRGGLTTEREEIKKSPGKKIPSHLRRYANVKSKIDQSDPNPAHKLKREFKDLIIDEGRKINPRFTNTMPIYRRRDTISILEGFPQCSDHRQNRLTRSLDSSYRYAPPERPSLSKIPLYKRKTERMESGELRRHLTFEEDDALTCAPVDLEVDSNSPAYSKAFTEDDFCSGDSPLSEANSKICGMEVTNSSTETTVILQHLLALSGKMSPSSQMSDMTIIEEDESEEEYYESETIPPSVPTETLDLYTIPHPIPRLIITDEVEGLVEIVIERPKELRAFATVDTHTVDNKKTVSLGLIEEDIEDNEEYPLTKM